MVQVCRTEVCGRKLHFESLPRRFCSYCNPHLLSKQCCLCSLYSHKFIVVFQQAVQLFLVSEVYFIRNACLCLYRECKWIGAYKEGMTDCVSDRNVSCIARAITDAAYVWRDSVFVFLCLLFTSCCSLLPTTTFVFVLCQLVMKSFWSLLPPQVFPF